MSLPVGQHIYPFSFYLPDLIPSSYEGTYGHIRYVLKATIERPWNSNTICSTGFAVMNPFDLNLDPVARVVFCILYVLLCNFNWFCCVIRCQLARRRVRRSAAGAAHLVRSLPELGSREAASCPVRLSTSMPKWRMRVAKRWEAQNSNWQRYFFIFKSYLEL